MVYLQDLHNEFSRLMADSEQELRRYAKSQKIPMSWIQYPGTWYVHCDVTGSAEQRIKKDPGVKKATPDEMNALSAQWKTKYETPS
jgi:hypothetical protein